MICGSARHFALRQIPQLFTALSANSVTSEELPTRPNTFEWQVPADFLPVHYELKITSTAQSNADGATVLIGGITVPCSVFESACQAESRSTPVTAGGGVCPEPCALENVDVSPFSICREVGGAGVDGPACFTCHPDCSVDGGGSGSPCSGPLPTQCTKCRGFKVAGLATLGDAATVQNETGLEEGLCIEVCPPPMVEYEGECRPPGRCTKEQIAVNVGCGTDTICLDPEVAGSDAGVTLDSNSGEQPSPGLTVGVPSRATLATARAAAEGGRITVGGVDFVGKLLDPPSRDAARAAIAATGSTLAGAEAIWVAKPPEYVSVGFVRLWGESCIHS